MTGNDLPICKWTANETSITCQKTWCQAWGHSRMTPSSTLPWNYRGLCEWTTDRSEYPQTRSGRRSGRRSGTRASLQFNSSKCQYITFFRKKSKEAHYINIISVQTVSQLILYLEYACTTWDAGFTKEHTDDIKIIRRRPAQPVS